MLNSFLNVLFRCPHRRTTFPLTPARNAGFSATNRHRATYVVCLDCGKELGYDWSRMCFGEPVPPRVAAAAQLSTAQR